MFHLGILPTVFRENWKSNQPNDCITFIMDNRSANVPWSYIAVCWFVYRRAQPAPTRKYYFFRRPPNRIIRIPANTMITVKAGPRSGPKPAKRWFTARVRISGLITQMTSPIPPMVQRNLWGVPRKNRNHLPIDITSFRAFILKELVFRQFR